MSAVREINQEVDGLNDDSASIGFDTLSKLTGFPVEFIKTELLLSDDNISMSNLRLSVLDYIKRTGDIEQAS